MKNKPLFKTFLLTLSLLLGTSVYAQQKLPDVLIKNLNEEDFNTSNITNDGPIVISFWATWCKPCLKELGTINDELEDWVEETGVRFVAVSIDDTRNTYRVEPFINGRAWEFEVLLDPNGELKRALNVGNIPHTFVLNSNREVVWQHAGYAPGDEVELLEVLKKVKDGIAP
jgi:cytochrome c biogenesis protein CcmG, thiol:disulfide interchange protein DsbE